MSAFPIIALCWRIPLWPEADQAAWARNIVQRDPFNDPFDEPRYANKLAPPTLARARKSYGRWLCFLNSRGWLDPEEAALTRVTRPRLRAYFRTLLRCGNAPATIISRFSELQRALRILTPGSDVGWVGKPDGMSIRKLLPNTQRFLLVPHSDVLFAWGLGMMDEAAAQPQKSPAFTSYRDGLLIAMFAARGRRLRSMSLLRINKELQWHEPVFRIVLTPDQVKTRKHDRFDLPERLTPYISHYLQVIRPALLDNHQCDAVWISKCHKKLTAKSIQERIFTHSKKRFGIPFGPHRFRHAVGTTAPLVDPSHPGLAAGLLGISREVLELHYNRSGQIEAATAFAKLIDNKRREIRKESPYREENINIINED